MGGTATSPSAIDVSLPRALPAELAVAKSSGARTAQAFDILMRGRTASVRPAGQVRVRPLKMRAECADDCGLGAYAQLGISARTGRPDPRRPPQQGRHDSLSTPGWVRR